MRLLLLALLLLPLPVAAKNLASDPYLFHSGTRKNLDEDIAAGNVPQDAWDRYIFGKTNFDLPDYRKGLYGAEAMSGTGLYSLYGVLGGEEPWVMVVQLKPECVTGDALYAEDYTVAKKPEKQGRFSRWYIANRDKYKDLEKDCLADFGDYLNWETGAPYDLNGADPETQRLTRLCTPVLDAFLKENSIKVAFDGVNDDSWYVRDRDCIAGIRGAPDEIFQRMLSNQIGGEGDDFVADFYGDAEEPGVFFFGNTYIFLAAAAETALLGQDSLPALKTLDKALTDWIGDDKVDESKLNFGRNNDNPAILRMTVRALERAVQSGRVKQLQASLRGWLKGARSRLTVACDGKHGVRPEKTRSCDASEAALSRSLASLLR